MGSMIPINTGHYVRFDAIVSVKERYDARVVPLLFKHTEVVYGPLPEDRTYTTRLRAEDIVQAIDEAEASHAQTASV